MIRLLSKEISEKIAAGEVVERPVSMVKELVENSIDAGASLIVVEIKNGGKTYLRVTDNGEGIPSNQASLAFQRHATSKISKADDLDHIGTLGFRGEALSSIAAVSRTEFITKTADEKTGTRLFISGGDLLEESVTGCPDGSTIIVRDLFFNTPARLKFLKPDATESSLIIDFVSQMALAYPKIKFRLINNEQPLFSTSGKGDRLEGIHTLYGKISSRKLIPIQFEHQEYRLEGYVSDPSESRSNRKGQVLFVNGRAINNKPMERGIDRAFAQRLFDGRYPVAYLFLELPPEELDVNIHPNKREIRFHKEPEIERFIENAVYQALQQLDAIPQVLNEKSLHKQQSEWLRSADTEPASINPIQVDIKSLLSTMREQQQIAETSILEFREEMQNDLINLSSDSLQSDRSQPVSNQSSDRRFHPEELRILSTIFNTYILAASDDTLFLIDQHAAHERVLFEKIMAQYEASEKNRQTMLVPFSLNCSIGHAANWEAWIDEISKIGFSLSLFGPNTLLVKEIPFFMTLDGAQRFLSDFLDQLDDMHSPPDRRIIEKAASRACKEAVKGNESLTGEEISELLKSLSKCDNPLSCPHGRPTFIRLSQSEIEKKFRRT